MPGQPEAQTQHPPLRILVCVLHNSQTLLPTLADSVGAQLQAEHWRVVLVDSGSTDASVRTARRLLPTSDVVELRGNRGFAAGINAGVRHGVGLGAASGRAVHGCVVMNPDVTPHPGCLDAMIDSLDLAAGIGITAPRLHDEHGDLQPSLRRRPTVRATLAEALLGGPLAARLHMPTEVIRTSALYERAHDEAAWATGGLLAFSLETFAKAGPWNEAYFLYEEEVEFCLRAADQGLRLRYIPTVAATRHVGDAPVTPWAEALMKTNRVRHIHHRHGLLPAAAHFGAQLLAVSLRALRGRRNARAARDSLLLMLPPDAIMRRYAKPVTT